MLKNRHKRKFQTTIMVIHILMLINAEGEGQLKSREQGAWGMRQEAQSSEHRAQGKNQETLSPAP